MDYAIEQMDAVQEHQWPRRGALARAMAERRRFFIVRLDLGDGDEQQERADAEDQLTRS